ncbi:MAG TPA: alpha/beta hydrolase [Ktedonobacterales bacterium]
MSEPEGPRDDPKPSAQPRPDPDADAQPRSRPVQGPSASPVPPGPETPEAPPAPSPPSTSPGHQQLTDQPGGPADPPGAAPATGRPTGARPATPAAKPTRGSVRTIHYDLSYLVSNAERGPKGAFVLLHDLPGGAFVWQNVMPTLAATGRAVYAFDLLGYGNSDHPWPADETIWGHADALAPALAELGLTEIILVGFGVGGGTAQVLATRLARHVPAALVLVNTYAYSYAHAADWPMTQMTQRQDPDAPRHVTTERALADLRATLPTGAVNAKFLAGSTLDAYVNEWNSDLGRECLFQHIRQMVPNYTLAVASDLKRLDYPVLIVWGERDEVTPLTLGRRLANDIPGSTLSMVPNAGHLILDDASDAVAKLLADFASTLPR